MKDPCKTTGCAGHWNWGASQQLIISSSSSCSSVQLLQQQQLTLLKFFLIATTLMASFIGTRVSAEAPAGEQR
jgi:hypothetical protein